MSHSSYYLLVAACFIIIFTVNGSKILFIAHLPAKSHFSVFEPIIEGLAARSHEVTVQSYFQRKPFANVKTIALRPFDLTEKFNISIPETVSQGSVTRFKNYFPLAKMLCEHYLTDDSTKELISKGKNFDLVIVDELFPECAISAASLLSKNTMYLSTGPITPWLPVSIPAPPSYIPNYLDALPSQMSFWQRLQNALSILTMKYLWQYELIPQQQAILSKLLAQAPKIEEAHHQVSFRLTNADPVMLSSRPLMPNIAHCGGMHCTQPKPLVKALNDFVESSGQDGFIVFGLGSVVKPDMTTAEFEQAFISAFGRLKQKVIWKLNKKLENLPKNVKLIDWMPQQDLLGHPKIRLFITHAGLLSLQEAIFHGVPVITIPLFAEQPGNAARIQELGIGETVSFLNVTSDGIYHLITKMIRDNRYKDNMKKYSAVFRDQPYRPVDKATFWIEYVIRHDGAHHFRSAGEDLNFFQYFLLDGIAFILLLMSGIVAVILYCIRICLRKCRSAKKPVKDESKKKK